jgi:uncharacterized damage-inducible protein DinB
MGNSGNARENSAVRLSAVYDGWVRYNDALLEVLDNSPEEFLWSSTGRDIKPPAEILRHIALGRIEWLARTDAPGFVDLRSRLPGVRTLDNGAVLVPQDCIALERQELRSWLVESAAALERTLSERTLSEWTTDDLPRTFCHPYQGTDYALSAQWVLFRIVIHDFHHGGQLSMLCQLAGVDAPQLVWLGGHLTEPPVWRNSRETEAPNV